MSTPIEIKGIRIITVSGRIASGSTTLAKHISEKLNWRHIEGGEVFWEEVRKKLNLEEKDTNLRPDKEDLDFDEQLKKMLKEDSHIVLETKLSGFNAQGIDGIFKILVVCEREGEDQSQIRIDRLVNREAYSIERAKEEAVERENNDLDKWRKLYAMGDPTWVYFEKKYYDLVINTYDHNQDGSLKIALDALGVKTP